MTSEQERLKKVVDAIDALEGMPLEYGISRRLASVCAEIKLAYFKGKEVEQDEKLSANGVYPDACDLPDNPSDGQVHICYLCGQIWQWDEAAEIWETIGELEETCRNSKPPVDTNGIQACGDCGAVYSMMEIDGITNWGCDNPFHSRGSHTADPPSVPSLNETTLRNRLQHLSFAITGYDEAFFRPDAMIDLALADYNERVIEDYKEASVPSVEPKWISDMWNEWVVIANSVADRFPRSPKETAISFANFVISRCSSKEGKC